MERPPRKLQPLRDPARAVHLHFEVRLAENDLAPENLEGHPVADLFFSGHFERAAETGGVVNVHMDDEDPRHVYVGGMAASLLRENRYLPSTAAIGCYLYAVHRNDRGNPCYVEIGTAHASLMQVMQEIRVHGAYRRPLDLRIRPVVMGGMEPIRKAVLDFCVRDVVLGPKVLPDPHPHPLAIELPTQRVEQCLVDYVGATMQEEQAIPDTWPRTDRMRAPCDLSPAGIESTGSAFLPVAAFAAVPTPRANEAYFLNALDRVLARRDLKMESYLEMAPHDQARSVAMVCTYGVQTFDYISDTIETSNRRMSMDYNARHRRIDTDSFSNIWRTCSGDCEDGCRGIQCVLRALIAVKSANPIVQHMQAVAKKYIVVQMLTVVHGAKVGDETEAYGAHLCDVFLPIAVAERMLAHTQAGRALLRRAQPARPPAVVLVGDDAAEAELPVMVGEGTGVIDPLGVDVDDAADARQYVANGMPAAEVFKREVPHIRGQPSSFYHGFLLAITDHWLAHGVGALVVGTPVRGQTHEMTRGALFTDVMAGRVDRVALMPQTRMPAQVAQICEEANKLAPPTRPLELAPREPQRVALLDAFCDGVRAFGRTAEGKTQTVDLMTRAHQYDADRIQQLLREAAAMPRLYKATYEEERITQDITSHRIRLWINNCS